MYSFLNLTFRLRMAGARRILRPPLILADGTRIELTRTYYDYLVLWENIDTHIYEKYLPQNFSPGVIFDLGAHKGFFSIMAAKRFPEAEIYAVEPSSANFRFLLRNTTNFPKIHPIHAAIWNTHKMVLLHTAADAGVSNSLFSRYGLTDSENVKTITFEDLPKADFIKCDIEGAEHALSFTAPFVAMEVHDDIEGISGNVLDNLKRSGYEVIFEPPIAYAHLPTKQL
jgi:FkbM family methyltransferase